MSNLVRKLRTKSPYKSAIQIAVEDHDVGNLAVVLGQGDYPTFQQIADGMTGDMNAAADRIEALEAENARLMAFVCSSASVLYGYMAGMTRHDNAPDQAAWDRLRQGAQDVMSVYKKKQRAALNGETGK